MGWLAVYQREMMLMRMKVGKFGYVFSTLLFPLIYLLAFGWGLGATIQVDGGYIAFLAKGMVSITVMMNSFQQTSLSVSVGRFYFRTFQTVILSPVSPMQIILGITLAGVTRGLIAGGVIYGVAMLVFGVPFIDMPGLFGVLFSAICFAALGIAVGLSVQSPDALSMVINFIITPMTFFCGSFFPLTNLPEWLQIAVRILPLSLANELLRVQSWSAQGCVDVSLLLAMSLLMFTLGVYKVKTYSE
ncbi:MAG: nodJ: type transporter, NodJ family [Firmicutes bacterium]|nr:nodJ: type transporter, NodJ family [Bacillota bacterium]